MKILMGVANDGKIEWEPCPSCGASVDSQPQPIIVEGDEWVWPLDGDPVIREKGQDIVTGFRLPCRHEVDRIGWAEPEYVEQLRVELDDEAPPEAVAT